MLFFHIFLQSLHVVRVLLLVLIFIFGEEHVEEPHSAVRILNLLDHPGALLHQLVCFFQSVQQNAFALDEICVISIFLIDLWPKGFCLGTCLPSLEDIRSEEVAPGQPGIAIGEVVQDQLVLWLQLVGLFKKCNGLVQTLESLLV